MSNPALNWAFSATVARSSDKFVLVGLANYADDNGVCYPSQAKLIRDTSLDRKTIIAATKRLCELGLIVDTGRRKGGTNQIIVYRLALELRHDEDIDTVPNVPNPGAETVPNFPLGREGTVPVFPVNSPNIPTKESQFSQERVPKTGQGTSKEPPVEPRNEPPIVREPVATGLFVAPVASKPNGASNGHRRPAESPVRPSAKRRPKSDDVTPECLAFWQAYPRKRDGIGSMLAAWNRAITRAPAKTVMAGLARFPFSRDAQYHPMASTWLNRSQWGTEADTAPPATAAATDRRMEAAAIILGRPIVGVGLPEARASPSYSPTTTSTIDIDPGDWNAH